MAKNDIDDIKDLQDQIFASNYGLSRKFLDKNQNEVFRSNKAVHDALAGIGMGNSSSNSLRDLSRIVNKTIRYTETKIADRTNSSDDSGFRSLTPMGNIDQSEQQVIAQAASQYRSYLETCPEYRGIVNIIPQVKRAIRNIVRDIMNVSELTGKSFNEVYSSDDGKNTFSIDDENKEIDARCTEKVKEIIKANDLEKKNKRWIYESCICGVKPIAFIPYKHIINDIKQLSETYDVKIDKSKCDRMLSGESVTPISTGYEEQKEFNRKAIETNMEDVVRTSVPESSVESIQLKTDERYDDILDDLVDDYAKSFESMFNESYVKVQSMSERIIHNDNVFISAESGGSSIEPNSELMSSITKSYSNKKTELDSMTEEDKKKRAKDGLKVLASWIDENINVVKPDFTTAYIANKSFKQKDRYSKFYNLGKDYKMAEGIGERMTPVSGSKDDSDDDFDFDTSSQFAKECLIVPYAPEDVIPININGEYLGFYAIEYDNITGPNGKRKSRSGSFTDYVQQHGFGDDKAFVTGSGSPPMAYGGADPLENSLYSPVSLYNYSASQFMYGGTDKDDERFDILKTVVLRVLSHRLRDPELVENKLFKDAVMNLLRNDVLMKKRVQFTYIPPEYMCYMTYDTDDEGLPVSILDGTLFFAYLYISSIVSSGMIKLLKSSDKEKYEIDVGLQKNANYSVTEFQKTLSTRSLYSSGMFGSLSSVIRNAGSYQRLIIPVIKGNKLYDVTQMERYNNLDPDDSYTDKLLQSVLDGIYINSGSLSEMDSVDFAKQLFTRQMEYRNNIIEAQNNYYPNFITKQVRLLTKYSGYSTYDSREEKLKHKTIDENRIKNDIDIAKINVKPSIPTYLSMSNIIEHITSASDVASKLTEVYSMEGGNETDTKTLNKFKEEIIKKYVTIVDWDELDNLLRACKDEGPKGVLEQLKVNSIDEKINNPIDETQDLNPSELSGGDSAGGDFGSSDDFGGDSGGDDLGDFSL